MDAWKNKTRGEAECYYPCQILYVLCTQVLCYCASCMDVVGIYIATKLVKILNQTTLHYLFNKLKQLGKFQHLQCHPCFHSCCISEAIFEHSLYCRPESNTLLCPKMPFRSFLSLILLFPFITLLEPRLTHFLVILEQFYC